ncbi:DNA-processing protein DprA [Streptomyces sodiiphilus]|uniref:DNA-processing protein DprA n=1 Tax=Streptomyces sodiiphilus TaxID=226217 RepID=A0ABN2NRF5_9ACTN
MTGRRELPAGRRTVSGQERLARAALTRIGEPGEVLVGRWLAELGPEETWRALRADRPLPGAGAERREGLRLRTRTADPEKDLAAVARAGGRFVCPGDPEWPGQLDDLGTAGPVGLWLRGAPSLRFLALRSVAVVGARACTDYGAYVAADIGGALSERGWTVVSGAAHGIDGAAHRGVLATGGATVAVLACGVDVGYPAAHRELLDRVAESGLVAAELPPGSHPTRRRFLERNRVIAALTRGTVVVEAALRSGSLVTARRARDLGRHVMGVPGPVTSGLSQGVHRLLRDEATLVSDAEEIIELTGEMGELAGDRDEPAVPRDLLAPPTARVLDALPSGVPCTPEEVAEGACTSVRSALARLNELHALGFVERVGQRWRTAHRAGRPPGARGAQD